MHAAEGGERFIQNFPLIGGVGDIGLNSHSARTVSGSPAFFEESRELGPSAATDRDFAALFKVGHGASLADTGRATRDHNNFSRKIEIHAETPVAEVVLHHIGTRNRSGDMTQKLSKMLSHEVCQFRGRRTRNVRESCRRRILRAPLS